MIFTKTGHVPNAVIVHESFIMHEIIATSSLKSPVDECVRSGCALPRARPTKNRRVSFRPIQKVYGFLVKSVNHEENVAFCTPDR